MKFLALMTLVFVPTIPALIIAGLWIWIFIRMKRDPTWRGLAHATAPVVVPTDR